MRTNKGTAIVLQATGRSVLIVSEAVDKMWS